MNNFISVKKFLKASCKMKVPTWTLTKQMKGVITVKLSKVMSGFLEMGFLWKLKPYKTHINRNSNVDIYMATDKLIMNGKVISMHLLPIFDIHELRTTYQTMMTNSSYDWLSRASNIDRTNKQTNKRGKNTIEHLINIRSDIPISKSWSEHW